MIIPPFLSPRHQVGIAAPAKKVDKQHLNEGVEILRTWGLEIVMGAHVYEGSKFLAGNDTQRSADLQRLFNDPEIKAIFCARGGYGTGRILDSIDFASLQISPKWIIGFSDITLLHLKLNQLGIASIHSPMPAIFHKTSPEALEALKEFLFTGKRNPLEASYNPGNKEGKVHGEAVGGNLSLISNSLGTPLEINTDGKILVLEEVDEPLYKIDRMFWQLEKAGKLKSLQGLAVGQFTLPDGDAESYDYSVEELIIDYTKSYKYPVAFDFPFGHEKDNQPVPLNFPLTLDVTSKESLIVI